MQKVITYNFTANLIDEIAGLLHGNFVRKDKDLSRVACVFGGKRPALFLNRALARTIRGCFIPPRIFSIDEFMRYLAGNAAPLVPVTELDACYSIYTLARKIAPHIVQGRDSFGDFLPWAQEIIAFIEQLDLENIPEESLRTIQKSSSIGYEIPENINVLLRHIIKIRAAYHAALDTQKKYSRGLVYMRAGERAAGFALDEFDTILFCNFYYLHATEQAVVKEIMRKGKGICIFQGDQEEWSVLQKNADYFAISIKPAPEPLPDYTLNLYQGFDTHSQVCIVREILKKIKPAESTVIVLPRPEAVIPLLSEIAGMLSEFNVSMGYPLKRSSLYALFDTLFRVQESRKDRSYYSKDYLNLLRHPLVKNLKLGTDEILTRIIVHKIEEILQGKEESVIAGSLFLTLQEIEAEEKICALARRTLTGMGKEVTIEECTQVLKGLHEMLFKKWEAVDNCADFAQALREFLDVLAGKSMLASFPLNLKVMEKLYAIQEELQSVSFAATSFPRGELWEIFRQKMGGEMVSFSGSPLRGTQVLGLFETRSLNFENVIVMDANESVLPRLTIYEPLIPREVMLSLGLNRLEKEEEIQRYQFMRLISSAKNVYLVYEENREKEKSRFIEELLWKKQEQARGLETVPALRARFEMKMTSGDHPIVKTSEMVDSLRQQTYSASRINTYLNCPLQFYYRYVLGLDEKEDLLEEPDAAQVGTFIHELLFDTFRKFLGAKPVIDGAFEKLFFSAMERKFEKEIQRRMRSDSILLKGIIEERLKKFLEEERERSVERIISLEDEARGEMAVNKNLIQFRYTVDRIDEFADKSVVIIDYKTGGVDIAPKSYAKLKEMEMTRESIKENLKSFQLPLYYYFTARSFPDVPVNAELYSIRSLEHKAFISDADAVHKDKIMEVCLKALEHIFSELFDPNVPFAPDRDERRCEYCAFWAMCC